MASGECSGFEPALKDAAAAFVTVTHDQAASAFLANNSGLAGETILPESDPLTQAVQSLVDRMHQSAVTLFGKDALAGISAPKALVVVDDRPGAFGVVVPTCYAVSLDLPRAVPATVYPDAYLVNDNVTLSTTAGNCQAQPLDAAGLDKLIAWYNGTATSCRLANTSAGGQLHVSLSGCDGLDQVSGRASRLNFNLTSNYIAFFTGRVLRQDEDEFSVSVAHELAHLYQLHGSRMNVRLDFDDRPYRLDHRPSTCAPAADPSLTSLDAEMLGLYSTVTETSPFPASATALLQAAATTNYGRYSYELEADEHGVRVALAAGIPADRLASGDFKDWAWQDDAFAKQGVVAGLAPTALSLADCRALAAAGWVDAGGTPVYPPVADLRSPYRSFCFRIFNAALIGSASGYAGKASAPWASQLSLTWADVQSLATQRQIAAGATSLSLTASTRLLPDSCVQRPTPWAAP